MFNQYLNRVQFWQVVRAFNLITEEEKEQETVQSVGFYFDLLTDIFRTVEEKFGAPVGHLLLPMFDQAVASKFGNIQKDSKTLKSMFLKRYVDFLEKVLAKLTKEQREEVMKNIFKMIKID